MSIARRLYILTAFVTVVLLILVGMGLSQISTVFEAANFANVNTVPSLLALDDGINALATMRVATLTYLADSDEARRATMLPRIDAARVKLVEALDKYEKEDIADQKDRELLTADRSTFATYDALRVKVLALGVEGKMDEAKDLLIGQQAVVQKALEALREHQKYNVQLGAAGAEQASAVLRRANLTSSIIGLIAVLAVAAMALMLARKIVSNLNTAIEVASAVAAGDLTKEIDDSGKDEIAQLMRALKEMSGSLEKICSEIRHSTDAIATASSEIATGNMDLSSRTEQQAGALEETASSMEELTSTVKQNSDNARQANVLAQTASKVAVDGGAVVSQVVGTMAEINDSAKQIEAIISVIDGIAFQTNILALNAAVEAARAGEQGRGFAVVASEVRNLAQRSASAAKEIKTLIDNSVEKVASGSRLVDEAGVAMSNVVESIRRVTDVVSEISSASHEQSSGIDQINQAVIHMDEATQQNAALVEQAAAAASSLQDQAHNLSQVVSVFKIKNLLPASSASSVSTVSTKAIHRQPVATRSAPVRQIKHAASHATPRRAAPTRPDAGAAKAQPQETPDWEEF
ncbi:methyl-accepting chemotaxis protein [Undibacterium sp. TJN19]|uniref:methyl-accepting chemotaxis protein n=1 Tax=Undibacterium sp. TJN19 TaxID=3413055 RepID=UPI003BF3EFF9